MDTAKLKQSHRVWMPAWAVIAMLWAAGAARAIAADTTAEATRCVDAVCFGDEASEASHGLRAERSERVRGGLGEPARRLLPLEPQPQVDGGKLSFAMTCDPRGQNYFTLRLWGSDCGTESGRLYLFCNGRQVGYRHLGDVEPLDIAADAPGFPGRFFYTTTPLPLAMTQGQTSVLLEIRSTGRIWGYGENYAQYQRALKEPTRGIYRGAVHTDPFFVPPPEDKQGDAPANPPVRQAPGEEVIEKIKARVNRSLEGALKATELNDLLDLVLLARAYHVAWTVAYRKDAVVQKVVAALDDLARRHHQDKDLVEKIPKWRSFGPAGLAIHLLAAQMQPILDQPIDDDGDPATPPVPRRQAWSAMLQASREFRRTHRRMYTNQAMISDMNLYLSNRGLADIDPKNAMPEDQARRYLYEAVGIQPWLGDDTPAGPQKPLGDHHYLVTAKGLTKELGYVGAYGEILDWVTQIYQASGGDATIQAQLGKLARARSYFRYPSVDGDGCRAMVLETVVGWRDSHYPGDVVYGTRNSWAGASSCTAAALHDPTTVGFAQQMLADGQFFRWVEPLLGTGWPEVTITLMAVPDDYATIKAQAASTIRLPMSDGQPDFAWADEEDGVVAVKHGDERLYASLYWRARYAINDLARIHYITPRIDRLATIRQETQFVPSGQSYVRPDWVDKGFARGFQPPGDVHQAFAGERLPVAAPPAGLTLTVGAESPYAGKGSLYVCRYGHFLIGMNCTKDRSYDLPAPAGRERSAELISGRTIDGSKPVTVPPQATVVLYLK